MKLSKIAAVVTVASLTLTACGDNNGSTTNNGSSQSSQATSADSSNAASSDKKTVTVEDNYGEVTIPVPVERVASTDNRTFQVLEQWNIPLVAAPKKLIPKTVKAYNGDDVADMGSHREPNLENLVAAKPDLIISGQRFTQHYEEMKKLNPGVPIVDFEPRDDKDFFSEMKREVLQLGKVFNKEKDAEQLVSDFDKATERAKKAYQDHGDGKDPVMAVNVSGGDIGYIAPGVGRTFGPVFDLLGLKPALKVDKPSSNHEGDDISVEAIADSNPDWIFVMDRDGAINADKPDYKEASSVIADSEVLKNVSAVKDKHLVYAPKDTYINESIITYTTILNNIADAFNNQQ